MQASVPGALDKLGEWVIESLIDYAFLLRGLAQQCRLQKNWVWHRGSLGVEDDAWISVIDFIGEQQGDQ